MDPVNTPRTEKIVLKSKSNMNVVIGGFVVLVVALIAVTTYFLMTSETNYDVDNTGNQVSSDEYQMINSDWALYSVGKYGLTVEVPSYTKTWDYEGTEIVSSWSATQNSDLNTLLQYYDGYLSTISLSFLPFDLSPFACSEGCMNEHTIDINVYSNDGSKSLEEVSEVLIANQVDEEFGVTSEGIEKVSMFEKDVMSYSIVGGFVDIYGYVYVNDSYIYDIKYNINTSFSDSEEIANKVLNSIRFDK